MKTKGKGFFSKRRWGEGDKETPGFPTLVWLRLTPLHQPVPGFQIVRTAQRDMSRKKKNSEAYIIIIIIIIISFTFIFQSFAVRLRDSPLRFRCLFFCIRSAEAWELLKVAVSLKAVWWFSGRKKVGRYILWTLKVFGMQCNKTWLVC